MKDVVGRLVALAVQSDAEVQCAALRVIGALKITHPDLPAIVRTIFQSHNSVLVNCALDVLAHNPIGALTDDLITLFSNQHYSADNIDRALRALGLHARAGIQKRFDTESILVKKRLIDIVKNISGSESVLYLLDCILTNDVDILKYICFALKERCMTSAVREKKAYVEAIRHGIQSAQKTDNSAAIVSYSILLGYLAHPSGMRLLLSLLTDAKRTNDEIRRHALRSLGQFPPECFDDSVGASLLPLLDDRNIYVVQAVLAILKHISFLPRSFRTVVHLLASPYAEVRFFAIHSLGTFKTAESVEYLLRYLDSPEDVVQRAAVEALKRQPFAVPLLTKRLSRIDDARTAERIAAILGAHKNVFTKKEKKQLCKALDRLFWKRDRSYKNYHAVLKCVAPEMLADTIFTTVHALKRKKKYKEAHEYLQLLPADFLSAQRGIYEQATLLLKMSAKDVSFIHRQNDYALELLSRSISSSPETLTRDIRKDVLLDAEDYFYLGFHFCEKLFIHKDFGINMLQWLIKKYPRSRFIPKARQKLLQVGVTLAHSGKQKKK